MNRQFTLPALIACSVHATLLFAFSKPPSAVPVSKEKKPEYVAYEIKKMEEKPEESETSDARSASSLGKPLIAPPGGPETPPTKVSLDDFTMNPDVTHSLLAVKTKIIPGGLFSPDGDPNSKPGAENRGSMVFNPSHLDRAPQTRLQASPVYPHAMKTAGITGEVIVEFTVDEAGKVLNPRVVRATHREFEEPTLRAVAKWRFEPGTRRMKPVRFTMTVPVVFNVGD